MNNFSLVLFLVAALTLLQCDLELDALGWDGQCVRVAPMSVFAVYPIGVVSFSSLCVVTGIVYAIRKHKQVFK